MTTRPIHYIAFISLIILMAAAYFGLSLLPARQEQQNRAHTDEAGEIQTQSDEMDADIELVEKVVVAVPQSDSEQPLQDTANPGLPEDTSSDFDRIALRYQQLGVSGGSASSQAVDQDALPRESEMAPATHQASESTSLSDEQWHFAQVDDPMADPEPQKAETETLHDLASEQTPDTVPRAEINLDLDGAIEMPAYRIQDLREFVASARAAGLAHIGMINSQNFLYLLNHDNQVELASRAQLRRLVSTRAILLESSRWGLPGDHRFSLYLDASLDRAIAMAQLEEANRLGLPPTDLAITEGRFISLDPPQFVIKSTVPR